MTAPGSLVIGIGNPLRGDDGVGWRLAAELGPPHRSCQQLAPETAALLAPVQRVLFVDACCGEPCQPQLIPLATANAHVAVAGPGLAHHLTPAALLAISQQLYGHTPSAWQLLIPATDLSHGDALSAAMQAQLPRARQLLQRWLRQP